MCSYDSFSLSCSLQGLVLIKLTSVAERDEHANHSGTGNSMQKDKTNEFLKANPSKMASYESQGLG